MPDQPCQGSGERQGGADELPALAARLGGGDRRSTDAAGEVALAVLAEPTLAPKLVALLRHGDPIVRMRAADALEKATRQQPDLLTPFARELLHEIGPIPQQEVRWHVAQMIPRLSLDAQSRAEAVTLLRVYLADPSRIVIVEALTALAALARDDAALRVWLLPDLREAVANGAPSVRARARRLLSDLTAPRTL